MIGLLDHDDRFEELPDLIRPGAEVRLTQEEQDADSPLATQAVSQLPVSLTEPLFINTDVGCELYRWLQTDTDQQIMKGNSLALEESVASSTGDGDSNSEIWSSSTTDCGSVDMLSDNGKDDEDMAAALLASIDDFDLQDYNLWTEAPSSSPLPDINLDLELPASDEPNQHFNVMAELELFDLDCVTSDMLASWFDSDCRTE